MERYNCTIKNILKKTVSVSGRDWDRQLPLTLFTIRIHTHSSTGFSPFELVFRRKPCTLLDMAAEQWEDKEDEGKGLLEYATHLKDKLATLWEEVRENLEAAQEKQKKA